LPAHHRECLVLFYLENKTSAEAAVALGISEATFRVRLHRARSALRDELEKQLGSSLEQLRPKKSVVPSVMSALVTMPLTSGKGAFSLLPFLSKLLPFKALVSLSWLFGVIPGMLLNWWIGCVERKNYRDQEGFRRKLHLSYSRRLLWVPPLLAVATFLCARFITKVAGPHGYFLVFGALMVYAIFRSYRHVRLNRSPFVQATLLYACAVTACLLAVGLGLVGFQTFFVVSMCGSALIIYTQRWRPLRMDYSLILRAAMGLLPPSKAAVEPTAWRNEREMFRFAQFVGTRWLIENYQWKGDGLLCHLAAVKTSTLRQTASVWGLIPRQTSKILLRFDGSISAYLHPRDLAALAEVQSKIPASESLESTVAQAVAAAANHWREGHAELAERSLGQVPDREVFVVSPEVGPAAIRYRRIASAIVIAAVGLIVAMRHSAWLAGLRPVSVSEQEIRLTLDQWAEQSDTNSVSTYLGSLLVLPETNSFSPSAYDHLRKNLLAEVEPHPDGRCILPMFLPFPMKKLVDRKFLSDPRICSPTEAAITLRDPGRTMQRRSLTNSTPLTRHLSTVNDVTVHIEGAADSTIDQLRLFRQAELLDLFPKQQWIEKIARLQVLSSTPVEANHPSVKGWKQVHGLFSIPNWPIFQETYFQLAALEILGGLDQIDREACINRILALHRGQGFFSAPDMEKSWQVKIHGDTRDTVCAYESLRILGALDRVKDLEKWRFRPMNKSKADANGRRNVTWDEIEAWTCQQRLNRYIEQRRLNPNIPAPSLLQPMP
jgi:hypothetical protein